MGFIYDFFESVEADRDLTADRFANRFRSFITEGVIVQADTLLTTELEVTANDTDLIISIATGKGIIQGYFCEIQTTPETLTLDAGDSVNARIDRIILEVNLNKNTPLELTDRRFNLKVLKGTPAGTPTAPNLTRDLTTAKTYQVSLAQILVPATATLILT